MAMYYRSLKREMFCVLDKVDLSGIYFVNWLMATQIYIFLAWMVWGVCLSMLWLQGLPTFGYTWICLMYYRTRREMCFYCKFALIVGNLQTLLLFLSQEHF